jgi:MFS family permease
MLIGGAGVGLALGTLIASGSTALPHERAGTGAALVNTSRQVASSVGVAVLVAILGSASAHDLTVGSFRVAWLVAAVLAIGCAALAVMLPAAKPERAAGPALVRDPR